MINCRFGDAAAHGALIRPQAAPGRQAVVRERIGSSRAQLHSAATANVANENTTHAVAMFWPSDAIGESPRPLCFHCSAGA
jgi:hypothetical protein